MLPQADHLTIGEIAAHLRVSRFTVMRAIKKGELVAVRVSGPGRGGSKRIPRQSYLDYLARNTVPPTEPRTQQ